MKGRNQIANFQKLRTSLYIRYDRKEKLKQASKIMGCTIARLSSALLDRSRSLLGNKPSLFKTVNYQTCSGKDNYEISSVSLYADDYEFATSVRDLFKISVSFLFAVAIDVFLDDIVENGLDVDAPDSSVKKHNYVEYTMGIRDFDVKQWFFDGKEYWEMSWKRQRE